MSKTSLFVILMAILNGLVAVVLGVLWLGPFGDPADDMDLAWADQVIMVSREVVGELEAFRERYARYPESLDELRARGASFASPPSHPPSSGFSRWQYDRMGPEGYQLWVRGYGWASSYDALVRRHGATFPEPMASHAVPVGEWRYFVGFCHRVRSNRHLDQ